MSQPICHSSFRFIRQQTIESLNATLEEYAHTATGARHFHIRADDDNNVFLVGLRTVPTDSTGVAHILEHTVLCGSERFPVRDPFFMMTRRSLNTFMNAFTSSDWTAYPFASQNRKDFYNLMDVYLDAVFFARIDEMDFMQEGHRVEFETPDDPSTLLTFKGVVYNEMKGAMSAPTSVLWQALTRHLYPTTTYHHNSGGEPEAIPDLSYEALVAFYRRHYHPSNAVFMTYGNIAPEEMQAMFHDKALARFSAIDPGTAVPREQRYSAPRAVEETYALDEENLDGKSHVVVGWLLGENTDLEGLLNAQLLTGVLLENSASPLMQALETTDLGSAPSPLCGLEDSQRELLFVAGVEGSDPDKAEAVENLILDVLRKVAEEGVPQAMVESVLHQIELSQREITGDSYPYGLQLILHALPAAIHDGDPIALLDLEPALAQLRERIADPSFIPALARELLLDNPHRVRLTLRPDANESERKRVAERTRLDTLRAAMSEADCQRVVEQATQLAERQIRKDDPEILPKVTLSDIPAQRPIPTPAREDQAPVPTTWFDRSTNGLVYEQIILDLPQLDSEALDILPLYTAMLTELGSGGRDYLETAARHSEVTGGIHASSSLRAGIHDEQHTSAYLVLSGKALARNERPLAELLKETLHDARFDERPRIRELMQQMRLRAEQGIVHAGHSHAMSAAVSRYSPVARLAHGWGGLLGIRRLKALDDTLDTPEALQQFADRLQNLHERLLTAPRRALIIAENRHFDAVQESLRTHLHPAGGTSDSLRLAPSREATLDAWIAPVAQVNYCAKAYPAVPADHPDAAAFAVLGHVLRNGYLHRAIREQGGAYGGGAGYDAESAGFRFYSYRDPRLEETLDDFDRAIDWLLDTRPDARELEEAILGVIGGIDKPGSPAGEARKAYFNALHGRSPERLQQMRARILDVTLDDLRRVTETWLKPQNASIAVLTGPAAQARVESLGLNVQKV